MRLIAIDFICYTTPMDGSDSPEQPIPKETAPPASWTEIRNKYINSSYSETYQAAMDAFRRWEASPKAPGVEVEEWKRSIDEQIRKARELPDSQRAGARILNTEDEVGKISAVGNEMPPFGQEDTTRIYIGTDPRKTTDAYIALLAELEANGVIKDVNASLYTDALSEGRVTGNMMIIYDPKSRPEVLDKILQAYQAARRKHPEPFVLTPHQRALIMRGNLRNFHATIDANLSFVEQPATRGGGSFDTFDAVELQKAFGMGTGESGSLSDPEWLERTRKGEKRVLYNHEAREKIDKHQFKAGDILQYERKLSAPAIVQRGTIVAQQGF